MSRTLKKSIATNLEVLGAYLSKKEENLLHCFLQYNKFCLLLETVLFIYQVSTIGTTSAIRYAVNTADPSWQYL